MKNYFQNPELLNNNSLAALLKGDTPKPSNDEKGGLAFLLHGL